MSPEMSAPAGIAERLPWPRIAAPLAAAEDSLARLDERLRTSPIREGFIARTHFLDACASLWLEGELVHLEDLVLHDAEKDVRSPTHALTRAHAVLRARRRIASADPSWALSASGLGGLHGRAGEGEDADPAKPLAMKGDAIDADLAPDVNEDGYDPLLGEALTAVDAAMARADRAVAGAQARPREKDPLAYDPDWDEDGVVAWISTRAKEPLPKQAQEALCGRRTELGGPACNMRLSTATPTAVSARWPDRLRARRRRPMMPL